MKKSDLFSLIKKTIKQEKSKRIKLSEAKKERKKNQKELKRKRKDIDPKDLEGGGGKVLPGGPGQDFIGNTFLEPVGVGDDGTSNVLQTPTAVGCAFDEVIDEVAPAGYYAGAETNANGDIRLWAGNCDSGNSFGLYEDINDGWICCSANNPFTGMFGQGNHIYVDSNWGAWDILDGLTISAGSAQCWCPYPTIEEINGQDYIIDCNDEGAEDIATVAQLDSFFTTNSRPALSTYNTFGNATTGVMNHTGAHCAGCAHDNTEGCTNPYGRADGSTGDSTNILGCPDATGNVSSGGVDDMTCCNFEVTCATPTATVYNDGATGTGGTAIAGVSATNASTVTTPGGTSITADTSATTANFTETGTCQFPGCDGDGSATALATNYTTVVYAGGNQTGPTYIVDSSAGQPGEGFGNDIDCIPDVLGCTDDGSDPNGDSPFPGQEACNYNSSATTDDGSCDYDACKGCGDDGGAGNEGTNRPVTGFIGAACNYDNGPSITINDPTSCEYIECVGCMDNGDGTNDGTLRASNPLFTANVAACNYNIDSNDNPYIFTNHDADACEYGTCVGCMNPDACDNLSGIPAELSVGDSAGCDWSCYGCTQEGMNGDNPGGTPTDPLSVYAGGYTQDSGLTTGLPISATGNTPCVYTGCLTPTAANGTTNTNYVCMVANGALCETGGNPCLGQCPNGTPMDGSGTQSSVGSFVNAGGCTSGEILGCEDALDCNYNDLATPGNSADQTVGAGYCTGQKQDCVDCVVDGTTGLDTPGDPVNDYSDECGCTNQLACNYDSTASTNLTINLYNQNDCEVPGDCEICDTNNQVVNDPQCDGCTSPTACNFGWHTVSGQLNYDANGPIPLGSAGITDDGSCVEPSGCNMCIGNVQPMTSYDPAIGWTELDPSCDGCAVQGSCNYDPSASDDPAINPQWQSSCITPTACLECDGTPGPLNNNPLVPNPACACGNVIAYECNNEQNVRTIPCMTIDGDVPAVNDIFRWSYKVTDQMEGKKLDKPMVVEVLSKEEDLSEQIGPMGVLQQYDKKVPVGVGFKTLIVQAVSQTNGPDLPRDYPEDVCVDKNWSCRQVGGGVNHLCLPTTAPFPGPGVFATKQACLASGCQNKKGNGLHVTGYTGPEAIIDDPFGDCDESTVDPCSMGHAYNIYYQPIGFAGSGDGAMMTHLGCSYKWNAGGSCWKLLGPASNTMLEESKKLREEFKNEFINISKSEKEAKLRETIKRIIKNKKK